MSIIISQALQSPVGHFWCHIVKEGSLCCTITPNEVAHGGLFFTPDALQGADALLRAESQFRIASLQIAILRTDASGQEASGPRVTFSTWKVRPESKPDDSKSPPDACYVIGPDDPRLQGVFADDGSLVPDGWEKLIQLSGVRVARWLNEVQAKAS